MGYSEDWHDLMFSLQCITKNSAKKQFRQSIKYAFGGLCAYCRCRRATTIDHLRPKSRGGSNLRSNLLPACLKCNHDKGSENWLTWYQRQEFYNKIAEELIEEWVTNKQLDNHEVDLDEGTTDDRTTICTSTCSVRSITDEPARFGEDCLATA